MCYYYCCCCCCCCYNIGVLNSASVVAQTVTNLIAGAIVGWRGQNVAYGIAFGGILSFIGTTLNLTLILDPPFSPIDIIIITIISLSLTHHHFLLLLVMAGCLLVFLIKTDQPHKGLEEVAVDEKTSLLKSN